MKKQFLLLSKNFMVRNSLTTNVLQNLVNGSLYELTNDQYEFICLLNGTKTLSEIKELYTKNSIEGVLEFLKILEDLSAVMFVDKVQERIISHGKVPDRRLESVHLEASGKCNMKCVHCYQGDLIKNMDELSQEEVISLLDQMQKMQIGNIGISGGEPLLMNNLEFLLRSIEERSIRISALFTNGLLVDENFVKVINSLSSKFPVFVSLDSIPGNSFMFRGFSRDQADVVLPKIVRNIQLLVDSGIRVTVNTVVNYENINYLEKMYDLMKQLGVKSWRLGFPKQTSLFKAKGSDFNVSWEDTANRCFGILKNHLANGKPFDLQIEYLYREILFKQGLHNLSGNDFVCDYEGRRGECCIKPNGDVVSCAYCTETPIGNIRENSLSEIWYSPKMQGIKMIRIDSVKECIGCDLISLCGTGCRANAYFLHGDFYNAKDDYACIAVKFFKEKVAPLLREYGIII